MPSLFQPKDHEKAFKRMPLIITSCAVLAGCTVPVPVYDGIPSRPETCSVGFAPIRFVGDSSILAAGSGRSLSNVVWIIQNCKIKKIEVIGLKAPNDDSLNSKRSKRIKDFLGLFEFSDISFDDRIAEGDDYILIQWSSSNRQP